jgi:hypothetical protein
MIISSIYRGYKNDKIPNLDKMALADALQAKTTKGLFWILVENEFAKTLDNIIIL